MNHPEPVSIFKKMIEESGQGIQEVFSSFDAIMEDDYGTFTGIVQCDIQTLPGSDMAGIIVYQHAPHHEHVVAP